MMVSFAQRMFNVNQQKKCNTLVFGGPVAVVETAGEDIVDVVEDVGSGAAAYFVKNKSLEIMLDA